MTHRLCPDLSLVRIAGLSMAASVLALTGCFNERSSINPVPPAPLASGYQPQTSETYQPFDTNAGYGDVNGQNAGPNATQNTVLGAGSGNGEAVAFAPAPQPAPQVVYQEAAAPTPVNIAPEPAPVASSQTHKVVEGDTLWDLSVAYYGSGLKWEDIADANPGINPQRLRLGSDLIIP